MSERDDRIFALQCRQTTWCNYYRAALDILVSSGATAGTAPDMVRLASQLATLATDESTRVMTAMAEEAGLADAFTR